MRAAAYCRFSSDNQDYASIDAQLRAVKEFCAQKGHYLVQTYIDEARSATTDDRPQFMDMIHDAARGSFDAVIVHKLDRFARNRYDAAFYRKRLKDNGVSLISILEPLDDSPESIILESVLEGMAEYFSRNLAREVAKGRKEAALKCQHTGGLSALGYDVTPEKTYVINQQEAAAVRLIFESYIQGDSYPEIQAKLNRHGHTTKKGAKFGRNSLYDILNNERYAGVYVFNKIPVMKNGKRNSHASRSADEIIRIPGGMPAIISPEVFEMAQRKMLERKQSPGRNSAKNSYLLTGLVFCEHCGAAMTGCTKSSGRGRPYYSYYECSRKKVHRDCPAKSVPRDQLDQLALHVLEHDVLTHDGIDTIITMLMDYFKTKKTGATSVTAGMKREVDSLQKQIDGLMKAIMDGLYTPAVKSKMETLEARKEFLVKEIKIYDNVASTLSEDTLRRYLISDMEELKRKNPDSVKTLIRTYIRVITVFNGLATVESVVTFAGAGKRTRTSMP